MCWRLWCPDVNNYSNHTSSAISCHSQMGIQAVLLVFQQDHVHREDPVTTHRLMTTPQPDWITYSHSPCSIIYISASGLISLQSVCLAMLCLGEKPDPRHPSQMRGETEQIKPCCPSVILDGAELRLVCCILEKSRCWESSAVVTDARCLFKELEVEPQPQ